MTILEVIMIRLLVIFGAISLVFSSCIWREVCGDQPRSWTSQDVVVKLEEPKQKKLKVLEPAWTTVTRDEFVNMLSAVSLGELGVIKIKENTYEITGEVHLAGYLRFIEKLNEISTYKRTSNPGFSTYRMVVRTNEAEELKDVRFKEGKFHEVTIHTFKLDPKPRPVYFETNARMFIYDLMSACGKNLDIENI